MKLTWYPTDLAESMFYSKKYGMENSSPKSTERDQVSVSLKPRGLASQQAVSFRDIEIESLMLTIPLPSVSVFLEF